MCSIKPVYLRFLVAYALKLIVLDFHSFVQLLITQLDFIDLVILHPLLFVKVCYLTHFASCSACHSSIIATSFLKLSKYASRVTVQLPSAFKVFFTRSKESIDLWS